MNELENINRMTIGSFDTMTKIESRLEKLDTLLDRTAELVDKLASIAADLSSTKKDVSDIKKEQKKKNDETPGTTSVGNPGV